MKQISEIKFSIFRTDRMMCVFFHYLRDIVTYIVERLKNPAAANKLIDDVESAIMKRSSYAESFEPYHSAKERKYPYYRIYVGSYVVYYVVIGDVMEVRRILYNKRNVKDKL